MTGGSFVVYGKTLSSELDLRFCDPHPYPPPEHHDITIRVSSTGPVLTKAELVFAGSGGGRSADGRVYRHGSRVIVVLDGVAGFTLVGGDIVVHRTEAEVGDRELEALLLGTVLPLWIDLNGGVALHGAAVEAADGAIAIIGPKGIGKSTTAAAMLRCGAKLLSDDVVAIMPQAQGFGVAAASPWVRLSAQTAQRWRLPKGELYLPGSEKVVVSAEAPGLGGFSQAAPRLRAAYLLSRSSGDHPPSGLAITCLGPADATIQLTMNATLARVGQLLGLGWRRTEAVARAIDSARIAAVKFAPHLVEPEGLADALLADAMSDTA